MGTSHPFRLRADEQRGYISPKVSAETRTADMPQDPERLAAESAQG